MTDHGWIRVSDEVPEGYGRVLAYRSDSHSQHLVRAEVIRAYAHSPEFVYTRWQQLPENPQHTDRWDAP